MTGIATVDEIIEEQGWSDGTLLELLVQFVKDGNHAGAFVEYLSTVAKQENEVSL